MVPSKAADCPGEEKPLREILAQQAARYPRLQVPDLYKLLYQAVWGSEHAVDDAGRARAGLECEAAALQAGPVEPAIEPISPDGCIVRVNLRPYLAGGGALLALLEAFLRTARSRRGSPAQFRQYWAWARRMAQEGALHLDSEEMRALFAEMEARGFPAVHHSEEYARAYHPAYRVVAREYLAGW